MENLIIKSPAKINLFLKVVKKLPNGYHELDTAFQLIDVFDTIEFQNSSNKISVFCSDTSIDEEENIIFKAASILKKVSDRNVGVDIKITKNIPIGAGLGGGSSNAASTICALNKMWDLRLSLNEMMLIGLDLGADVPLFIKGENAYAGGVGEKLVEKKPIDEKLIIISPDILNSTEEMFNLYDIQEGPTELFSQQNSFWKVFVEKNEEIKEFYEQYAKKFEICLSGTGSSMFIKYNNNSEKQKILKTICVVKQGVCYENSRPVKSPLISYSGIITNFKLQLLYFGIYI